MNYFGVVGAEVALTARADDAQSETNRLNERGITTVFNSYGTGYRMWGNRLACFPAVSHIKNFEVAQRTGDLIDESIRRAELQYVDRPIDEALIDSLIETVRTYWARSNRLSALKWGWTTITTSPMRSVKAKCRWRMTTHPSCRPSASPIPA